MEKSGSESAEKRDWALLRCRDRGMRRTRALVSVLELLIRAPRPLTLADLAEADDLKESCDRATIYRLLVRLEERGIIRRLGLHERSAYYTILYPDEHYDYLICTECGSIDRLDMPCPVEGMERKISHQFGFKKLYHELEFFGICSHCG